MNTALGWLQDVQLEQALATGSNVGIVPMTDPIIVLYRSKDTSISAIAWNPFVATQIAVAYEEDRNPVVQVWDLRRSAAPVYELQSHTQVDLVLLC